jgi:hypothetical protein
MKQPAIFSLNEIVDVPLFGRFPKGFMAVATKYLDTPAEDILHVCSGYVRTGITVDIRAGVKPRVVADCKALPFCDDAFDAAFADPPYTPAWARQYGTGYPPTTIVLRELCRVTRPGRKFGMIHLLVCPPPKNSILVKVIGVTVGLGYQIRALTIYQKKGGPVPMFEENTSP